MSSSSLSSSEEEKAGTSTNTIANRNIESGKKNKRNYPLFDKNTASDQEVIKRKKGTANPLKIWTWNVAGLRACVKKGGHMRMNESNADIISLQETKCSEFPPEITALKGYNYKKLLAPAEGKSGYAGVAMISKEKPIKVEFGLGDEEFDSQGRYIQAEFSTFFFISIYVPNSGRMLVNLAKRGRWDKFAFDKITGLDKHKPVIIAGDMNVAHQEIDLRNPDMNRNKTAGFTDQERNAFSRLLDAGFIDVWRARNPKLEGAYTYWSYIGNRRANNVGWRLDYFIVSERIFDKVRECEIHSDINGSDHCPLSMTIDI